MTRELEWDNVSSGGNKEQTPFLKLQQGDNRIRVVGKPVIVDIHWESTIDDPGKKKKVICPGPGCPLCKIGHAPQARYQVLVIDRTDNEVKILEGGPSIFGAIRNYAMDKDYGDPTKYDLKIKKEGTGRETKYTVLASPKQTELTPEELEKIEKAGSLLELNKPKSIEEIYQMGLEALVGSVGDLNLDDDKDDFGEFTSNPTSDSLDISDDWESL